MRLRAYWHGAKMALEKLRMEKDNAVVKFELVTRAWTPIGDYGFEYYWDPDWVDPLTGCHEVHFMNTSAGYARQWSLTQTITPAYLEWLVPHTYAETESTWLRTNGLGKRG